jgi:signal transduction histidine kinase
MLQSDTRRGARLLVDALLDHLGGPERARAVEKLGPGVGPADPKRLAAAMRAAHVDESEARRIGMTAASAVDVALAARLAGVGSTERALRQADRLLPREHEDGVFEIRALDRGEACVAFATAGAVDPLLCAMRAGLLAGLPRCFGAEAARVDEGECAGRGAEACCYRVRWSRGIADRPLLHTLALGALCGAILGFIGWAVALFSPSASITLFAGGGVAAAGWLVESRRTARIGHQAGLASELELRIAERMDDLAKLDASLEGRETSELAPRALSLRTSESDAQALRREVAAFGRELAAVRGRAATRLETSDGPLQQDLEAIDGRFEQLRSLTEGLIDDPGSALAARREREDLSGLLAYVVQRARRADGNGPEIFLEVPADLPFVHCDAVQIERALCQLLRTACESAGPRGRVDVSASAVPGGVELTVRDDGAGVDPESVEEAFDPFFRDGTTASAEGEGLRLAAQIVAEHGGALQLQPDTGTGTRASFVLLAAMPG